MLVLINEQSRSVRHYRGLAQLSAHQLSEDRRFGRSIRTSWLSIGPVPQSLTAIAPELVAILETSQIKAAFGRATESEAIFAGVFDNTKLSITRASMPEQK